MRSDWGQKRKRVSAADKIADVLFVLAFISALAAGIRQIDVAKDARKNGTPQNSEVVGLLLAVKACKFPKTFLTFHKEATFYHGILLLGNTTALAIWSAALYYAMK